MLSWLAQAGRGIGQAFGKVGRGIGGAFKAGKADPNAAPAPDFRIPTNDITLDSGLDLSRDPLPDLPVRPGMNPSTINPATGVWSREPRLDLVRPPAGPPMMEGRAPAAAMPMEISREGVPVPQLPGRSGDPRPYDRITAEEYDYVRSRPNSENVHGFGARLKSGLKPAMWGAIRAGADAPPGSSLGHILGRMGGGAGAGMIGGAVDPTGGRQYEFESTREPEIRREMQREGEERRRQLDLEGIDAARQKRAIDLDSQRADIDLTRARTDATRAGMKDATVEAEYRRAQTAKLLAQEEAIRTGKPQVRNIVDESGRARTIAYYPDGTQVDLGGSEKYQIAEEGNKTRKEIADERNKTTLQRTGIQQSGATGRAAMAEAGRNRRFDQRNNAPAGGGAKAKTVSSADVKAYAQSRNISEAEARKRFTSAGHTIQ